MAWLSFYGCVMPAVQYLERCPSTRELYRCYNPEYGYYKPEMRGTMASFDRRPVRLKGGDPLELSYL